LFCVVTLYVGADINLLPDLWAYDPQSFSQVSCFVSALAFGTTLRFGPETGHKIWCCSSSKLFF